MYIQKSHSNLNRIYRLQKQAVKIILDYEYNDIACKRYCNDPKFSDKQVWANSIDPDLTVPEGAVWWGSTVFAILSAPFDHIEPHHEKTCLYPKQTTKA